MTWDPKQSAVFSAAIRSHRMASATLGPARISPSKSVASSSWFVRPTSARARNVARHWLTVALVETEAMTKMPVPGLTDSERSGLEEDARDLRMWLDDLGPFEPLPLLLTDDMRVEDPPLTSEELTQAVVLGLRLEGSTD